jgi:hypothetical protein
MALSISGEGYETFWNRRRIFCIKLLIPRLCLKDFVHVLDRNVVGHVSARSKGIARVPPCGQTDNGVLLGVYDSKRER